MSMIKNVSCRNMVIQDFGEKYIDQFTSDVVWKWLFMDRKWNLDEIYKYHSFFNFNEFLSTQSLDSDTILNLEVMIDEYHSWDTILKYQVLDPEIIMWCKSKVNFSSDFIINQHWEPWMIYSLSSDELDRIGGMDTFLVYQLLPEEFILENKYNVLIDNIIENQRLTPRLIEELNIERKIKKKDCDIMDSLDNNLFYKTDIGKDWFIAYIGCSANKEGQIPRYFIMHPNLDPSCFYNRSLKKVRVWYKDHICFWHFKKVEIIKEVGSVGSFTKRFPPSEKP